MAGTQNLATNPALTLTLTPTETTNIKIEKEMFGIDAAMHRRASADDQPVLNGDPMLGGKAALVPLVAYVAFLMASHGADKPVSELLALTSLDLDAQAAVGESMTDAWLHISRELAARYSANDLRTFALAYNLSTATAAGKAATQFYTPDSISDLALAILAPKEGDAVADFGCGWGGFLARAHEACPGAGLYGVEADRSAYALACARLDLAGARAKLRCGDMLAELGAPASAGTLACNKIFCQPPLGMRPAGLGLSADYLAKIGRPASGEWVYLRRVCQALRLAGPDARAVVVVGNGAAINHADARARALLLQEGLVRAVISLPANLLRNTSVSLTMLVLGRGSGDVRVVDATDLCARGRRWNAMSQDHIAEVLRRLGNDCAHSASVAVQAMCAADSELSACRYLARDVQMVNPTALGDLALAIDRGVSIKAADLDELQTSEDTGVSYLPVSEVGVGRVGAGSLSLAGVDPKLAKATLRSGDLVVTKTSMPIRTAVADIPEGRTVIASGNLFIVRLDVERVDPYFVAAFLASDDGRESLLRIVKGSTLPTITASGLRGLKVPLPTMDVQRRVAARYRAALDELELLEAKVKAAKADAARAYAEGIAGEKGE